jgi:hypothetical protein
MTQAASVFQASMRVASGEAIRASGRPNVLSTNYLMDGDDSRFCQEPTTSNCMRRSDIREEASVKDRSKTSTGLPSHPFGISRRSGVPCENAVAPLTSAARQSAMRTSGGNLGPALDLDVDPIEQLGASLPLLCFAPQHDHETFVMDFREVLTDGIKPRDHAVTLNMYICKMNDTVSNRSHNISRMKVSPSAVSRGSDNDKNGRE